MALYIPFDDMVEVNGQTIFSFLDAVSSIFQKKMMEILAKHHIVDLDKTKWYKQTDWLHAFKEIEETVGDHTLFSIGKAIPENAIFPPDIDSLEGALNSINIAYQTNHRGGEIGYYKLMSFDLDVRRASMKSYNPYPDEFDRGIITAVSRKFRPENTSKIVVNIDTSNPQRKKGADSTTYVITW